MKKIIETGTNEMCDQVFHEGINRLITDGITENISSLVFDGYFKNKKLYKVNVHYSLGGDGAIKVNNKNKLFINLGEVTLNIHKH